MPSTFTWRGMVSTDATDPLNWSGGPGGTLPGQYDDLLFTSQPDPGPPPTMQSAPDCVGLAGTFASITITSGYTNTVTFGGAVTVGTFWMEGGAIAQPAAGSDLTVNGSFFTWTGGTLNSSTNLANVTITGSTTEGLIEPTGGGTVNLGSNLTLSNGAVVTAKEGTLNVTNEGTVIKVNANSEMLVNAGVGNSYVVAAQNIPGWVAPLLWVDTDAWFKVVSGDYPHYGTALISGGSFILEPGTTADFGYFVDPADPLPDEHDYFYLQTAGATYIAADASLYVGSYNAQDKAGGMRMSGGLLSIKSGTQPQFFDGHIVGDLKIVGGDIRFESMVSGDNHEFALFLVDGKVWWEGGTYHPYVSSEDGNISDVWRVTGAFSISATAAVDVTAVDGENNVVTPDSGMEWFVLRSDTSITTTGNDPSLTTGYSFVKDQASPAKWWKVKKN